MLDFDKINNADPRDVGLAVMSIADATQNQRQELRAMAAAAYYLMTCEAHELPPQSIFTATKNLLAEARDRTPELAAAHLFIANET